MKNLPKISIWVLGIVILSLVVFFPSFNTFYTNDDFFLLKISNYGEFGEFLNFFNLTKGPDGLAMYRPLTTQVFYSLAWKFFNLNPLWLHLISFLTFTGIICLVYKFTLDLSRNGRIALLSTFLYAVSASHFGHLYYLATFQELGMTLFVVLSCFLFLKYLEKRALGSLLLSFLFFIFGLFSKETAVVTPFLLILLFLFTRFQKVNNLSVKKLFYILSPFVSTLFIYFAFRLISYGFATGDSYVWNFSPIRALNTLFWYGVWAFNLPEMLVDFVGPGLSFNPNLMKYYAEEIISIAILFSLELLVSVYGFLQLLASQSKKRLAYLSLVFFGGAWFVLSLFPVLFLPLHKFTFYLSLPLVGFVVSLATILASFGSSPKFLVLFTTMWLVISLVALKVTFRTNWITQGAAVSKKVFIYFQANRDQFKGKTVLFYDQKEDLELPWSPTLVLKNVLSDNNFFLVLFDGEIKVRYGNGHNELEKIPSRQFLGY